MQKPPTRSWETYRESTQYLAQGSSTSSKASALEGIEPAVLARGKGCRVWDLDGNEYINFRNALGPVTLGYALPEINAAIAAQLEDGIIYGHPHLLEGEVAHLLTEVIPCAERVRFLKTGGEAIAACFKIARNATKRNKIYQCGYNGWLNVLSSGGFRPVGIASAEPEKGVPAALAALHRTLPWGDIEPWKAALAEESGDVAAVCVASSYGDMQKGAEFLPALRALTRKHGVLMIMDEIVTGFRIAIGGAQEYFDFVPDMAVFGKGLANGMPISVYTGRADLIDSARGLGISSTFGGEALSLAAAKAVIAFYQDHNVTGHIRSMSEYLWGELNHRFETAGVNLRVEGLMPCPLLSGDAEKTEAFLAACYRNGISFYHVPYVNYSHQTDDAEEALRRLGQAVAQVK